MKRRRVVGGRLEAPQVFRHRRSGRAGKGGIEHPVARVGQALRDVAGAELDQGRRPVRRGERIEEGAVDGGLDGAAGLLIAPRLGMNFLVGRSGILTPYLNVDYTSAEVYNTPQGDAVAVDIAYGGNIGYTVMW